MTVTDPFAVLAGRYQPSKLAVYRASPAAFAHDLVDWRSGGLASYQTEVLEALPDAGRMAVRGPHGLGKTCLESLVLLWFALTRDDAGDDWKAPSTASAWHQLTFYLWPEIHKWARRLRWDRMGREPLNERTELLERTLKLNHGEAFSASPRDAARLEGAHGDSILYLFDEAKAVPNATFDAAEGAFSGAGPDTAMEAFAFACSTPGEPNGRFYDIHRRLHGLQDWTVRHVTIDEVIKAGRVSADWVERKGEQWGTESALFANRVLGEFATADEDGVIPLAWVEAAVSRWKDRYGPHGESWEPPGDLSVVGVDVARSGSDKTVYARRYGEVVGPLEYERHTLNTMVPAARITGTLRTSPARAVVDVIGIGAGVYDKAREDLGERVVAFNAAEGTKRLDLSGEFGFANCRAAAWWNMRELLDPSNGADLALPPDDLLTGDLTAPRWRLVSGGRILVEPKDDIRKRLGRSTDAGDAVVQALWPLESHEPSFPIEVGRPPAGDQGGSAWEPDGYGTSDSLSVWG